MKIQTKYFFIGVFFFIVALFGVTFLPLIFKNVFRIVFLENFIYFQISFISFAICSALFTFSPRYFKEQILTILLGFLFYILFIDYYPF
jgi:hypothetical protein